MVMMDLLKGKWGIYVQAPICLPIIRQVTPHTSSPFPVISRGKVPSSSFPSLIILCVCSQFQFIIALWKTAVGKICVSVSPRTFMNR